MRISQLEYPITNKYTIPYLPLVFYLISFWTLCLLIPLNIALVGSDVVSTLRSDPTSVIDPWWMPSFWPGFMRLRTLPQICQPASITDNMPLRTNSSVPAFTYVLRHGSAIGYDTNDPASRIYPAPYMGNPLSNCQVNTITLVMQLPAKTMTYTITVRCELGGNKKFSFQIPDNVTFSTVYQRSSNGDLGPDDMIDYLAFNVIPEAGAIRVAESSLQALPANSSSSNNVLGVLDAFQADLFQMLWAQMSVWNSRGDTYPVTNVVEWAAGPLCRANISVYGPLNTTCDGDTDVRRIARWYGAIGDRTYQAGFMASFNVTLINMFVAMRDAVMIDLGNVNPATNIYLNKSYFDTAIRVDPYFASAAPIVIGLNNSLGPITEEIYWHSCTWGWNCVNTTTWAEALLTAPENTPVNNLVLPYKPNNPQAPSVLSFSYLCPTFQRKPTDSLLISVFVATATMFSVLYSIFATLMPKFERRYQKKKEGLGRIITANNAGGPEGHQLMERAPTYDYPQFSYSSSSGADPDHKYEGYNYSLSPNTGKYQPVDDQPDLYYAYGHRNT
ncbi:hypothetical protein BDV93DRAFT_605843 [Ceratobasidium sp. AG-I]|nr:hypothetical protein BDV93DRAFT_605843 [Ceratobasidium sp. AG-I]